MIVGFKTGPQTWTEGQRIVREEGAKLCELWFEVEAAARYEPIIAWLRKQGVNVALHHWGVVDGRIKTNLSTHHEHVRAATMRQIKDTIDAGAAIGCAYVNIHPGAQALEYIDFSRQRQSKASLPSTPLPLATTLLENSLRELRAYAETRGVLLTVETLPGAECEDYGQRQGRYVPGSTSLTALEALARAGHALANDLTHTIASLALAQNNQPALFQELLAFTKRTASATRLLHVNTVVPPLDGTDSHNGLLPADWQHGAFPSRQQLQQLLAVFRNRPDVFVIPEPRRDMPANYRALQQLVSDST